VDGRGSDVVGANRDNLRAIRVNPAGVEQSLQNASGAGHEHHKTGGHRRTGSSLGR
jgi:hypothetical protein